MRQVLSRAWIGAVAVIGLGLSATPANAAMYHFGLFGNYNTVTNQASPVLGGGITMEVTDAGSSGGVNRVLFTFTNVSATGATLSEIYFDDGTLLGISSVVNQSGVNFTALMGGSGPGTANPGNLPGGNQIDFETSLTGLFAADIGSSTANGLQVGESVGIVFDLINGQTFAQTIAALQLGLTNPGDTSIADIRVGIHVRDARGNDNSLPFINVPEGDDPKPPLDTPAPGGLVLALVGLPFFVAGRKLRRKTQAAD